MYCNMSSIIYYATFMEGTINAHETMTKANFVWTQWVNLPWVECCKLLVNGIQVAGFVELLTPKVPLSGRPVRDGTKKYRVYFVLTAFFDRKESGQKETPDLHYVR